MDEAVVIGACAAIIGTLVGIVWKMVNDKINDGAASCRREFEHLKEEINLRDQALWNQIGRSSEEGMRVKLHHAAPMASVVSLDARVTHLEDRSGGR